MILPQSFVRPIQLGWRNVALHKLRSTLTTVGIVLGVASVIVMLAIGEAARSKAIEQIEELGATNIILRSVKPKQQSRDATGSMRLTYGLTAEDLSRIQSTVPTVVSSTPIRESRRELQVGDRKLELRLVAVTPAYFEKNGLHVQHGRFITEIDNMRLENVVVLTTEAAAFLFPIHDPLGKSVRIDNDYYRVVGVAERTERSLGGHARTGTDLDREAYVPFATDKVRFGRVVTDHRTGTAEELEINQITIGVAETKYVKNTAMIIESLIAQFHDLQDVDLIVPLELLEKAKATQRVYAIVLGAIASISLVVGGIGIMNIMLATVTERTREIGIRRALGAKRCDIVQQFLIEAILLSSIGGVLGAGAGITLSYLVTHLSNLETIIRPGSVFLAFTISTFVGLIFGTYPARRAAFMDPIEALRHA